MLEAMKAPACLLLVVAAISAGSGAAFVAPGLGGQRVCSASTSRGRSVDSSGSVLFAGFGAAKEKKTSVIGTGLGPYKKQTKNFLNLVKGGRDKVCVKFVATRGVDKEWLKIGEVGAPDEATIPAAVQGQKKLLIEYAKELYPELLLEKVIEVGVGEDEENFTVSPKVEYKGELVGVNLDKRASGSFYGMDKGSSAGMPGDGVKADSIAKGGEKRTGL